MPSPLQQAPKTHSERNWLIFVFLLFVIIVAMVWFYMNNTGNLNSNGNFTPTKKVTQAKPDPTKDWTVYSSKEGAFSLRYNPDWKTSVCDSTGTTVSVYLAPDTASLGHCGSEDVSQVTVSSMPGDMTADLALKTTGFDSIVSTNVTVSGVTGKRMSGTYKEAPVGPAAGTKNVTYLFFTEGRTYLIQYVQKTQDVLSDFDLMVKNTFKFSA